MPISKFAPSDSTVLPFDPAIFSLLKKLEENIASVFLGKPDVIQKSLVALISGEHLLLEDVPGVGKTILARAMAQSISATFHRIQLTPDFIPADITGGNIFDPATREFRFVPGPIFTNILLADEINRTSPRTQSAMLEAMSEHQVSCDGVTYPLSPLFMVIATENPMEFEGTYPLPESQLDRFLLRLSIGYPNRDDELRIMKLHQTRQPIEQLTAVLCVEEIQKIQQAVRNVFVDEKIHHYILDLLDATRSTPDLYVGISLRGGIMFCHALQAWALLHQRNYVIPDDVKELAVSVLAHRIILRNGYQTNQSAMADAMIERFLETVPVPS